MERSSWESEFCLVMYLHFYICRIWRTSTCLLSSSCWLLLTSSYWRHGWSSTDTRYTSLISQGRWAMCSCLSMQLEEYNTTKLDKLVFPSDISEAVAVRIMKLSHVVHVLHRQRSNSFQNLLYCPFYQFYLKKNKSADHSCGAGTSPLFLFSVIRPTQSRSSFTFHG